MAHEAEEVYLAGLELGLDERAVVAHRLLASLHSAVEDSQVEIDDAWRDEIGSRVDELLRDHVATRTFDHLRGSAQALLADLRK